MLSSTNARRQSDVAIFGIAGSIDHTEDGAVINGVRAPKPGDDSYEIWAALNNLKKEWGTEPTAATAGRLAVELKRDTNSTIVTFLQWKKFHGIA